MKLYLELLKKSLLGELYVENEVRLLYLRGCLDGRERFSREEFLHPDAARVERYRRLGLEGRLVEDSLENLGFGHTMIGRARLENIECCLERVLADGVAGDLMECGVWRGGAALFMRGFLAAHDMGGRKVWLADSFNGPPAPSLAIDEDLSAARYPMLAIPLETVRELFARYGLLDAQVAFLPGWFRDTLPRAPVEKLALLRVDADLYESTRDGLDAMYGKVEPGGFVIVDDYGCIPACAKAVDEFREREAIRDPLVRIDWTGVYWRKSC